MQKLGKYILEHKIAQGGMAEIFLGYIEGEAGFKKRVCIKRILPHLSRDEKFTQMFIDEAKIVSQLTHPNIVQVYEFNETDGYYYIVMEYIEGVNLRELTQQLYSQNRSLPENIVAFIATELLKALHYAHTKTVDGKPLNIIHRDITPHNILISKDGSVKLGDFGIAKASIRIYQTQAGIIKGKFHYLSPEQILQLPLDHRTDLFSLGIVLFESVVGRHLFNGNVEAEIIKAVLHAEIPDISQLRPDLSKGFVEFILNLLQRDRDKRFQSASEALKFLDKLNITKPSDQLLLGELVQKVYDSMYKDKEVPTKTVALDSSSKEISLEVETPKVTLAPSSVETRTIAKGNEAKKLLDRLSSPPNNTIPLDLNELEEISTLSTLQNNTVITMEPQLNDKEEAIKKKIATAPTALINRERLKEAKLQRFIPTETLDKQKRESLPPKKDYLITTLSYLIVVLLFIVAILLIIILFK